METPTPITLTGKTMISALLFVAITPWSLMASPVGTAGSLAASPLASGDTRYFPQTNKTVSGDFLRAFDRYGLASTGWPISDEVAEGDLKVQYFERVRMERHPELASKGTPILLTRLGAQMAPAGQTARIKPFASTKTRAYFPQTGHSLSAPFMQFWRDHGGTEAFGYPISEQVWEGGLKVQWFERARMESHPESASKGWPVQLTRLGELSLSQMTGITLAPPQPLSPQAIELAGPETGLLNAINSERAKVGVAQVAPIPELADLARNRSADMASRNYFSHNTPEGANIFNMLGARTIVYNYAGEIIAKISPTGPDQAVQLALQVFLNSPDHKAIMLDPRPNYAGVGYGRSADGTSYFTVVFINR